MFKKRKEKKHDEVNIMTISQKELKNRLGKLEVINVGMKARNNQVIEGNAWGGHYRITKERTSSHPDFIVYMFCVSGSEESRLNLTSRFITLFGNPSKKFQISGFPDTEYFWWNATEIEEG